MCLTSSGRYRFEAIDDYSDGIVNGRYELRLDGTQLFTTPSGEWSRSVHKFDIVLSNEDRMEEQPNTIADVEEEEEEPELQLLMASGATEIPTSTIVLSPNSAPMTAKNGAWCGRKVVDFCVESN